MRTEFHEYYPPDEQAIRALWEESILVVDANVLLNAYRYTAEARERLLDILERLRDRLWIPYQFAEEYQRNRTTVIASQVRACEESLQKQLGPLGEWIQSDRSHVAMDEASYRDVCGALARIREVMQRNSVYHKELLRVDPHHGRITQVFEGRVGSRPDAETRNRLKKDAKQRFEEGRPPGNEDRKKDGPDRPYGDPIAWMQILEHAAKQNRSVILVSDDLKEDWWLRKAGRTLGPLPELVREFGEQVAGRMFHMYNAGEFVEHASKHLRLSVSESVLQEMKEVSEPIRPSSTDLMDMSEWIRDANRPMQEMIERIRDQQIPLQEMIERIVEDARHRIRTIQAFARHPAQMQSKPALDAPKRLEEESSPGADDTPPAGGKEEV